MNDENFLLEYEKLLDKGYCDCNEMNCIDNNSPRRILRIAKSLQQENKELKKQIEKKYEKLGTLTAEILYEENTRLANEITVLKTENQKSKEEKQELIDYLKKEQDRLVRECSPIYEDGLGKTRLVNEDIYNEVSKILSKIEKSDK